MEREGVCPQCSYRTTRPVDVCPACGIELVLQERTWSPTRRSFRVPLPPGVRGELDGEIPVAVLDLSPLGARLEHHDIVVPGQVHLLTFTPPDAGHLCLPSRIAWSQARRFAPEHPANGWIRQSGVEFQDVPTDGGRELLAYLYKVTEEDPSSSPEKDAPPAR
jgi:hypothetical protein